jgi:hypothetical protein
VAGKGYFAILCESGYNSLKRARLTSLQVPPKNQREMVPLGSSSESMYPGYSPAHIEYGKAAGEFGQAVGEMKARGEKWEPANGTEYQIGQAHGAKRKMFFQKDRTESTGSEGAAKGASAQLDKEEEPKEEETLGFVIDIEPTPVKLAGRSAKRPLEDESDGGEKKKDKKKKKMKEDKGRERVVETEDISAEVEARLRLKEEKKKSKEGKKRQRESTGDDEEKVVKKPKKDKPKKREAEEGEEGEEGSGNREGKKKRKKNKDVE